MNGLKIKTIKSLGIKDTYNITMKAPYHNYRLGSVISKNSHSVAYGMLSALTLWLKTKYTLDFMTNALSSELGDHHKTNKYIGECFELGIGVLPPDINKSDFSFKAIDDQFSEHIMFGLGNIKGINKSFTESLITNRPYDSIESFISKNMDNLKANMSTLEILVNVGVFDMLESNRKLVLDKVQNAVAVKQILKKNKSSIEGLVDHLDLAINMSDAKTRDYTISEKRQFESQYLGFNFI